MPAIKISGGKSPARTSPKRKPAAKAAPKATARTRKSAVVAAPAPVEAAPRSPKLPEGWTKTDFNKAVKDMQRAKAAREKAAEALKESQKEANALALELLQEGVQMSVISVELDLSRQWMYTLMEEAGIKPARSTRKSTSRGRSTTASKTTSKPAAKRRPAAKASAKPAAKRTPARKPAATAARGRIRIK